MSFSFSTEQNQTLLRVILSVLVLVVLLVSARQISVRYLANSSYNR